MNPSTSREPAEKRADRRRAARSLCGLALLLLQCGCSVLPPRLLSPDDRQSLGTIGVTAARYAPEVRIKGPGQRGGKAGIAIGGLGAAAATVASCLNPFAILTCPTMVLAMGALGATAGGVVGHQIDARITGAGIAAAAPDHLDDVRTQIALRDRVVQHARANTPYAFVAVDDSGPATRSDHPDYRSLSGSGIDTVLEVSVLDLTMEGRPRQGLFLAMASRVRIVRAASGAVVADEVLHYRSEAHPYERWAEKDARVFQSALESGFQHAAERISRELGGGGR